MYNAKLEILTFDIACKQISLDELQKIVVSITEMFEQPGNELAVVNNGPIMNLVFNTKNKLKGSSTEEINEAMDWATKTAKKLLGIK